ncbi:hypothetical protein HJFPF1_12969 [Paramyrothecium foliicola]|nr:hypothetical protein HJFPF1_12969 [Paramyrothecium foliicola]
MVSEYHHFIPQSMLKNLSHEFVCSQPGCGSKRKKGHKHEKGKYPRDCVIYHVKMDAEGYKLEESPIKRICGQYDMYTDWTKPTTEAQRHIETMFGEMKSQASIVIRKILKSHERGEHVLSLTRDERNLIRKFLFLLKYRGLGFHRRFYCENAQDYNSNDAQLLRDYMEKKGFKTPMDVEITEKYFCSIEKLSIGDHAFQIWSRRSTFITSPVAGQT